MFYGFVAASSVTIPDAVTKLGKYVLFSGCVVVVESVIIPETVTALGHAVLSGCTALKSVTMPETMVELGNYVFANCKALESVAMLETVTIFGKYAFYGYVDLESVTIMVTVITLMVTLSDDVFRGCCTALKSITIPTTVTQIGKHVCVKRLCDP